MQNAMQNAVSWASSEFCILILTYFPAPPLTAAPADAAGGRCRSRWTRRGRRRGCAPDSMKRPKIILPAVVCSTLVTTTSIVSSDHLACVVDDDHRAVIEIGDALVVFLPFLEDEDLHDLARQDDRLQRVRQLVDVQHFDAAKLRDLVQIEVVRDDLALKRARQLDQLQVDFAHVREVHVGDRDVHARHLLDLLQDVEAAAAAIALHRIGRVGDELQLLEHELRDHERAVHETGFTDVRDAAVDDDAGVEDLVSLAGPGRPEQARRGSRGSSHSPLRAPITRPRYGSASRMTLWRKTTRPSLRLAQ